LPAQKQGVKIFDFLALAKASRPLKCRKIDGILEAGSRSCELYGFKRTAAISTHSAEGITLAAQAFGQNDDITVVTRVRLAAVSSRCDADGADSMLQKVSAELMQNR